MRPTSVSMPVAVTTAAARPRVITVEASTRLLRSARGVSAGRADRVPLLTGADSPVRALSSAWRPAASSSRASAGTRSPASRRMMSPGTSFSASSRTVPPSRTARARGADICRSASRARRAPSSWAREMQALTTTITRMMAASSQSSPPPAHRLSPAAASSTSTMGSPSWPSSRRTSPGRRPSFSRLGPYRASRRSASAPVSPRTRSVSSASSACCPLYVCHAPMPVPPLPGFSSSWVPV